MLLRDPLLQGVFPPYDIQWELVPLRYHITFLHMQQIVRRSLLELPLQLRYLGVCQSLRTWAFPLFFGTAVPSCDHGLVWWYDGGKCPVVQGVGCTIVSQTVEALKELFNIFGLVGKGVPFTQVPFNLMPQKLLHRTQICHLEYTMPISRIPRAFHRAEETAANTTLAHKVAHDSPAWFVEVAWRVVQMAQSGSSFCWKNTPRWHNPRDIDRDQMGKNE